MTRTAVWKIAWPKIFLRIKALTMLSFIDAAAWLSNIFWLAGSETKASVANVSMIRLAQTSWIALRGASPKRQLAAKTSSRTTVLKASCSYRYLLTLCKKVRPVWTAETIEQKLSSTIIISLSLFAKSVPVIPILNPTCADYRAGASLVPSPVTATVLPFRVALYIRPLRRSNLC